MAIQKYRFIKITLVEHFLADRSTISYKYSGIETIKNIFALLLFFIFFRLCVTGIK